MANVTYKKYIAQRIKKDDQTGCWIWQLSTLWTGYGMACVDYKQWYAHRLAFTAYKGDIPKGMNVLHLCDVTACCNPDHLFLGTQQDNMTDCKNKNRTKKKHTRKHMSDEEVIQILSDDRALGKIAKTHDVTLLTIWRIKNNKTYKHVK